MEFPAGARMSFPGQAQRALRRHIVLQQIAAEIGDDREIGATCIMGNRVWNTLP
jgi:hypothetical protein